eukprot:758475-Hanusia_phi.AAC.2
MNFCWRSEEVGVLRFVVEQQISQHLTLALVCVTCLMMERQTPHIAKVNLITHVLMLAKDSFTQFHVAIASSLSTSYSSLSGMSLDGSETSQPSPDRTCRQTLESCGTARQQLSWPTIQTGQFGALAFA